ncbi:MAG TPA: DUF1330 domain-containing protein [Flavisolibacter sp.]|nr:DUF1330 domain-containing protein [Flavisolibacter sp.]
MPAYIIVEIEIHDPETYEEYKKLTPISLAAYRGKFIVRGGKTETLEGEWQPQRIVVLEFPTVERAKEWWASEEYAPAKNLRQRTAHTKMIVVEGFEANAAM